jgi:tRNA (guanine37-N1)-methyltransferase
MRFDVVTLFPEMFAPFLESGVTRRAYSTGLVDVRLHNPRDHAEGNYKRIDDRAFGGGPGMVMMAEPLARCLDGILAERGPAVPVVLFTPVGEPLRHAAVAEWAQGEGAVLLCGRYEGIDQRLIDRYVTHSISLGDFVLSGGEIAALALLDAVARLQPGVLNDADSHHFDSFHPAIDGLLDCPHFTRPEAWRDVPVPEVLLSGHHGRIARWRRDAQLQLTARKRPDLLAAARAKGLLDAADERLLASLAASGL